jgi:hypothetical protein
MNQYQAIKAEAERLLATHADKLKTTYGRDLIDFPEDDLIIETLTLPTADAEIEIGRTTEAARPAFHWFYEITIRYPETISHYLLLADDQLVEAYGRKVFDADAENAAGLLKYLAAVA